GAPAAARVAAAVGLVPGAGGLATVEGDLLRAEPVARDALGRLRASVRTVIHCAGDTTFFPESPGAFRAGHVDGPCALLRALGGGALERWAQVSTAYVCGRRSGTVLEGEGDVGQAFHNPYERVKLEAETAVRAAAAVAGVDCRVLRPAIVVGQAPLTAGGQPASLFFDFIRLVAAVGPLAGGRRPPLRIAAAPRAPFNVVPVDHVAAAVVALAEAPAAGRGTFHLVVPEPPSQSAMLAMIAGHLGVTGLHLVDARTDSLRARSPLEARVAKLLAPYREYLAQDVRFDDGAARAALDGCGVARPALDVSAVGRLVDQALAAAPVEAGAAAAGAPGGG
ncbi:MAG: SDR family oxidoreductase, partial [Candidatus Rokuibacteriota bacterium]